MDKNVWRIKLRFGFFKIQTNDNSFIISGTLELNWWKLSYLRYLVIRINEDGTEVWSHNYGGMGGGEIETASDDEYFGLRNL